MGKSCPLTAPKPSAKNAVDSRVAKVGLPSTNVVLQHRQFSAASRTKVVPRSRSSQLPAPQIAPRLKLCYKVTSSQLPAFQQCRCTAKSPVHHPALQMLHALQLYYPLASSHLSTPQLLRACSRTAASSPLPAPQLLCVLELRTKSQLSPVFRAHFRLTLFVPHSAFKREFIKWEMFFHRRYASFQFSTLTLACILTLAYFAF